MGHIDQPGYSREEKCKVINTGINGGHPQVLIMQQFTFLKVFMVLLEYVHCPSYIAESYSKLTE